MPEIKISKVKTRRGTDAQRLNMVFDQGELVSTTDSKRLFLGTGTLSGGVVIGSKIHNPLNNYTSLSTLKAEIGDIVNVNNLFYQLTATNYSDVNSWSNVGAKLNTLHFHYDELNKISLNLSSIPVSYIDPSTVSNGIKIENNALQSNFNTRNFKLSSYQLTLNNGGVNETEINSSTFTKGISGGSGNKIGLNVDTNYFYYNGDKLSLSSVPIVGISFTNLSSSWFGAGLNYNYGSEEITTVLQNVDNKTILNTIGIISVNPATYGGGLVYNSTTPLLSTNITSADGTTILKSLSGNISVNPATYGEGLIYNSTTPLLSTVVTNVDGTTIVKDLSGRIRFNSTMFGSGLVYNSTTPLLSTVLTGTDNISLTSTPTGTISIVSNTLSGTNEWAQITVDRFGRVSDRKSSILDVLTGNSELGSFNNTNTLSSIFNGDALGLSGLQITNFSALSSDGVTVINLSSAGFITFEGNTQTRNGNSVGRFAVPIFSY